MLFAILLTAQIIICVSMGGLILIQRSEGGALGMGGGPSGFMSARGAGNLLTRATGILAIAFFVCSIAMTIVGNMEGKVGSATDKVDTSSMVLDPAKRKEQEQQQQAAAAAAAASAKSSAPSLADLPLAGANPQPSSAAPASAAPRPASSSAAPVKIPTVSSGTSSSVSQQKIDQAKAGIWQGSSSSAASASKAPVQAPASSTSSTPR